MLPLNSALASIDLTWEEQALWFSCERGHVGMHVDKKNCIEIEQEVCPPTNTVCKC